MNEEFSGDGQGAGAWENKGVGRERRVWEMGEERACDGGSKSVESGEKKREITQQCLKFAIEEWLNDGKNKQ